MFLFLLPYARAAWRAAAAFCKNMAKIKGARSFMSFSCKKSLNGAGGGCACILYITSRCMHAYTGKKARHLELVTCESCCLDALRS